MTVRRKLAEIYSALKLEKEYTKERSWNGISTSPRSGRTARACSRRRRCISGRTWRSWILAQCASLIGITNNPSIYDPYLNPEKNKERQEIILGEMLSQGYITQKQYDEAKAEELVFVRKSTDDSDADEEYYSYFEDQVIRDVVNDLCDKTGYDYDIVYKMVMTGGYQIYSTYNPDAQAAVDAVYGGSEPDPGRRPARSSCIRYRDH